MTDSESTQVLGITALGIPVHGLPGPALLGESGAEVVLAVSNNDGTPATHLTAANFHIEEVVSPRAKSAVATETGVRTLAIAAFSEPRDGVYAVLVRRRDGSALERGPHAVLLSILDANRGRGRALVRLDA